MDIDIVESKTAHAVGEPEKRGRYETADVKKRTSRHQACEDHGQSDEQKRLFIGRRKLIARRLRIDDNTVG